MNDNFNLLMKTYMQCVKTATKEVMLHYKGENWFLYLKEKDEKAKYPILDMCTSIDDLDFQACNKLLIYNRELWNNCCRFYGKEQLLKKKFEGDKRDQEKEPYKKYESVAFDLIHFRNDYQGHYSFSENKEQEYRAECMRAVDNMRFVMSGIFSNVCDNVTGKRYIELFQEQMLQFYIAGEKRRYYLKDYLSKDEYDYSLFFIECARLGIQPEMDDGEEVFYSSDIQKDVVRLKNALKKVPRNGSLKIVETSHLIEKQAVEVQEESDILERKNIQEKGIEETSQKQEVTYKKIATICGLILTFLVITIGVLISSGSTEEDSVLTIKKESLQWMQKDDSLWCYVTVLNEKEVDIKYDKLCVDMNLVISDESTRTVEMVFDLYDFSKDDESISLSTCTSFDELLIEDGLDIISMGFIDYRFE